MILFWTAVAAVAASLSALFAAIYTGVTFRLLRTQGEPKVVVYVFHDLDRASLIVIRIANIGHDVASDVMFTASRPIPSQAFGMSAEEATSTEVMKDGPLIDGIPTLGPGDTRDITWGQYAGLLKAVGREPIDLTFQYKHGRRTFRGQSRLEVSSFSGTDASEKPHVQSARSLEKIAKSLDVLAQAARRRQKPQTPEQQKQIMKLWAAASGTPVAVQPKTPTPPSDEPPESQS